MALYLSGSTRKAALGEMSVQGERLTAAVALDQGEGGRAGSAPAPAAAFASGAIVTTGGAARSGPPSSIFI